MHSGDGIVVLWRGWAGRRSGDWTIGRRAVSLASFPRGRLVASSRQGQQAPAWCKRLGVTFRLLRHFLFSLLRLIVIYLPGRVFVLVHTRSLFRLISGPQIDEPLAPHLVRRRRAAAVPPPYSTSAPNSDCLGLLVALFRKPPGRCPFRQRLSFELIRPLPLPPFKTLKQAWSFRKQ